MMPPRADYQWLGSDIDVLPDLNEDEKLREDIDCLIQDIVHGWTQPTGIADGTAEGQQWGVDLRAQLSRGFTKASLFALKVALEVQAERDDRVESCTVKLTADSADNSLTIEGVVVTGSAPYPFSFKVSLTNVTDLFVERLG
jgi:hypothetical protein